MAEFHGVFAMFFIMSVYVAYRGVGGRWQKISHLEHPHAQTITGHRDVQSAVRAILGSHCLIGALHWYHCSSHYFGRVITSRKADQLTSNIGYTGDG